MGVMALMVLCTPRMAHAGVYDVQASDVRGQWKTQTDELVGIGRALWQAGQRDKAEAKFNDAWHKAKTPSDKVSVGEVLSDFYMSVGKSAAAVKIYELLLDDDVLQRDSASMARLFDGLGRVYYFEGQYVKSIKSYRTAETFLPVAADSLFLASLYSDMSRTLLEAGSVEEAQELVSKAEQYAPRQDLAIRIVILVAEAKIASMYGEFETAYEKMEQALTLSGQLRDSEIAYLLNSATPSKIVQIDRPKSEKGADVDAMRTAVEQADAAKRTAFASVLVVGLLCVAALIFLYLTLTRLRYYREKSHRLDSKLTDAQRVISVIAHDSNNQFNSILGMTGILAEMSKGKDKEMEQMSRHAFSSAQLLYQMMNNLLTWSKSKEHLSPKQQVMSLYDGVKCCVESVSLMAKDKDIEIKYSDVPDDIRVVVDFSHFEIILRNLVSNAVKFTERGGHVTIRAAIYSKHAALSVEDDGRGMSQEDVSRFNKEQDITPNAGTNNEMGNGIGLAICRDLVRNNGGGIVIEPGRKRGTSVTVLLNTV